MKKTLRTIIAILTAGIMLITFAASDDLKLWMNRGSTYESNVMPRDDISITKHGLKIPVKEADYAGFVAKMKTHEQEFVNEFFA